MTSQLHGDRCRDGLRSQRSDERLLHPEEMPDTYDRGNADHRTDSDRHDDRDGVLLEMCYLLVEDIAQ